MTKLIRIQTFTVAGSAILLIIKSIAYLITDSNAILSDALESIVNLLAGGFALYSLILSAKPKDLDHPYGHGKIEFISASFEGALILITGIIIFGKSLYNLFVPYEINQLDFGIYLVVGAGLVNFIMGRVLVINGKKHNSMSMEADGKHLLTDSYSTIVMIVGLVIVHLTGFIIIDNLMAMSFGIFIAFAGANILKKSLPAIMDEADMALLEDMVELLQKERKDNWVDLHNLRVIKYGSSIHIDAHMTLPHYFDLKTAHNALEDVDLLIRENFGEKVEAFVHMDPCKESQCELCQLKDCDVRKHVFKASLKWNLENVLKNEQHQYLS